MNMDKLSMDVPEEREALKEAFDQIIDTIVNNPESIVLVAGTNATTNEDVSAFAIEQDGQVMPFAVFIMPGDVVPRKSRTQKEIEEREKDKEFVLPEDARADEYVAPLNLDDFEDDDPEVD